MSNKFSKLTVNGITYNVEDNTKLSKPKVEGTDGQILKYTENGPVWTDAENGTIDLTPYAKTAELSAVAKSGSYNDLGDKPTIPTKTSELTNNSDFVTKTYVDSQLGDISSLLDTINGEEI